MLQKFKINNLRIATKISLIVVLFAMVSIGSVGFVASRMSSIDDAYGNMFDRVAKSTTLSARSGRFAATYLSTAYHWSLRPMPP